MIEQKKHLELFPLPRIKPAIFIKIINPPRINPHFLQKNSLTSPFDTIPPSNIKLPRIIHPPSNKPQLFIIKDKILSPSNYPTFKKIKYHTHSKLYSDFLFRKINTPSNHLSLPLPPKILENIEYPNFRGGGLFEVLQIFLAKSRGTI